VCASLFREACCTEWVWNGQGKEQGWEHFFVVKSLAAKSERVLPVFFKLPLDIPKAVGLTFGAFPDTFLHARNVRPNTNSNNQAWQLQTDNSPRHTY